MEVKIFFKKIAQNAHLKNLNPLRVIQSMDSSLTPARWKNGLVGRPIRFFLSALLLLIGRSGFFHFKICDSLNHPPKNQGVEG